MLQHGKVAQWKSTLLEGPPAVNCCRYKLLQVKSRAVTQSPTSKGVRKGQMSRLGKESSRNVFSQHMSSEGHKEWNGFL